MSEKKRLTWLDALKGIGILSIMRVHMMAPQETVQSIIYSGAVAMFFVCAGFNFREAPNVHDAIVCKAKRLLIPYLLYSIFLLIVEHRPTWEQIVGILYARMNLWQGNVDDNFSFMLIGNAPMWFLPCMFLAYTWIYLIYGRCKTIVQRISVACSFILTSAILYHSPIMLPWSIDTSFLLAVLLIVGYEFRQYFMKPNPTIWCCSLCVWLTLWYVVGGGNVSIGSYGNYGVLSMIPFCVIALSECYALSGILQRIERTWLIIVLAYIGKHSLRLMCIHLVIYYRVYGYVTAIIPSASENKPIVLTTAFIVIFAVDYLIERTKKLLENRMTLAKYL